MKCRDDRDSGAAGLLDVAKAACGTKVMRVQDLRAKSVEEFAEPGSL
jgi:hypothetical protein